MRGWDRTPNEDTPGTTNATVVSISNRYREREHNPVAAARPAASTATIPSHGRSTTKPASVADPGCVQWLTLAYRPKHIGSTIAFRVLPGTRRRSRRQGWHREGIELERSFAEGRSTVVLSISWIRTRRRAAASLFGSGWSSGWTWVMSVEVTAENRWPVLSISAIPPLHASRHTNVRVVFRSSPCFFMNSLSYSSASLR